VDLVVKNVPGSRDPIPAGRLLALIEFDAPRAAGLREVAEAVLSEAVAAGEIETALIAENASQARDFWALRERASAGHKPEGAQVNHDVSVPVSKTPDFLERADAAMVRLCPGARIVAFGHMGDGNFHYSILQPIGVDPGRFPSAALTQEVYAIVTALGGSISAEHGIGVARRNDLLAYKDPVSLSVMRSLKRALDPRNIMNPRVLIDQTSEH
jgi:FAD/FMN-containing dehydrogenase